MRRTSILLDDTDDIAIEIIKRKYGTESDSGAIRLALRLVSNSPVPSVETGSGSSVDNLGADRVEIKFLNSDRVPIRRVFVLADDENKNES